MATRKSKSMVGWEDKLAGYATQAAAMESSAAASGRPFLSVKAGVLSFNGAEIPGNKLRVVVLDHVLENVAYGPYDPDNPEAPFCFAFAREEKDLAPHAEATDPQCVTCCGCPLNEFGSAETGRGKACKNTRRLALIGEDSLNNLEDAEVAYFRVPVTSVAGWAGYVSQVASTLKRPPFGVVTEISVVPDRKSQFKVQFKLAEKIDNPELFEGLIAAHESASGVIMFPYVARDDDEASAKPQRVAKQVTAQRGRKQTTAQRGRKQAATARAKY